MPSFSDASKKHLVTCDNRLQAVFFKVIKHYDCRVLEGYRSNERQEELFFEGKTKLRAGQSKHNRNPSIAIDVVPYPVDWKDFHRFYHFVGYVLATGHGLGVNLRCGADWNQNLNFKDQNFHDMPHFELPD